MVVIVETYFDYKDTHFRGKMQANYREFSKTTSNYDVFNNNVIACNKHSNRHLDPIMTLTSISAKIELLIYSYHMLENGLYFWNKSSIVTILSKREAYSFLFSPYVVTNTDITVFLLPTISCTRSIRSRRVLL